MSSAAAQGYDALASLIERELQLVAERDFDELRILKRARRHLEASFPLNPPADAYPMLQRCVLLQKRVELELLRIREAVLLELAQVRHAQRAARGYAPARDHAPRVHTSA